MSADEEDEDANDGNGGVDVFGSIPFFPFGHICVHLSLSRGDDTNMLWIQFFKFYLSCLSLLESRTISGAPWGLPGG